MRMSQLDLQVLAESKVEQAVSFTVELLHSLELMRLERVSPQMKLALPTTSWKVLFLETPMLYLLAKLAL